MLAEAGFTQARHHAMTGFKSSPHTEGAVFSARKPD